MITLTILFFLFSFLVIFFFVEVDVIFTKDLNNNLERFLNLTKKEKLNFYWCSDLYAEQENVKNSPLYVAVDKYKYIEIKELNKIDFNKVLSAMDLKTKKEARRDKAFKRLTRLREFKSKKLTDQKLFLGHDK